MPTVLILVAAAAVFLAPLAASRLTYPEASLAGLPLLGLALVIVSAVASQRLALNRARLSAALLPESWLNGVLQGRFAALLAALALAAVAVPVMAWTALSATRPEALVLAALCLAGGVVCLGAGGTAARHFRPAYVRGWTVALATWLPAAVFVPILAWVNWAVVQHPVAYADMGLLEALQFGLDSAPAASGADAALMRGFQLAESLKLWLVHRFAGSAVPGLVYSLDAALVGLVFVRSFVAVLDLVRHIAGRIR
ncbi:MAG: hypothetical protein ACK4S2_04105 [Gemmobacter sp.]|uniref:hypothetical protein n=1 Tax=Gemmobacter sp. TaxID=1898957 RepID=UPI00391AE616